jgi:hypothetical protein
MQPTYCVAYLDGVEVRGIPFICPTFSRELFDSKKSLKIPCAFISKSGDGEAVLIDSFEQETLVQYLKAPIEAIALNYEN